MQFSIVCYIFNERSKRRQRKSGEKKNPAANQKSGKLVKYERSMLQLSERDMYWIDHYVEYAYVANEN